MLVNRQSFSDYKIQCIPGQNSVLPIAMVPGAIPDPHTYIHTYYKYTNTRTVRMYIRMCVYFSIYRLCCLYLCMYILYVSAPGYPCVVHLSSKGCFIL